MKTKTTKPCKHDGHVGRCTVRVIVNGKYVQCPCNVIHH